MNTDSGRATKDFTKTTIQPGTRDTFELKYTRINEGNRKQLGIIRG